MRSVSLERFVKEVFVPYAEQNRKRSSQDWRVVNTMVRFFKGRALQEIPPMLIEQYKKKAAQTLTPRGTKPKASTLNQRLGILHRVFSLAVENGYLTQNPVSKVKRFRETDRRERVMSEEEEGAIRDVIQADSRYDDLGLVFEIANHTGMRVGEILGLTFDEIDFERAEIRLPYTRTKEAKDKAIPLNSAVLALLKQVREDRAGAHRVFSAGLTYGQLGHVWRRVCKKAGVTNLHIHDLRHTFASRLLERGERETDINKILGHSKLRMTTKYLHSSEESRRRAVENLSQICHTKRGKVAVFGHK